MLRLAQSLIAFYGETTGDGAADGSTLLCSDLTDKPDFDGNQVVILSGDYDGQARDINGATNGGTVTPHLAFGGQIVVGVKFVILALRTVPTEVAGLVSDVADIEAKLDHASHGLAALKTLIDALEAKLDDGTTGLAALKALIDAIEAKLDDGTTGLAALKALIDAAEAKLDKLAGETPITGSVTANWQSGTGTSGETGADLVSLGANDTRYKLHSLLVNISALTLGATITVKLFMQVHGTERKVYSQNFTQGTDPDGLWIVNGTVGIHEALRVEVQSDNAGDNGLAVDYDYMLESM